MSAPAPVANWGRTQVFRPVRARSALSEAELSQIMRRAAQERLPVKAVGARHSFSGVALTEGIQVDVAALSGLLRVDADAGLATFGAGTPLSSVGPLLAQHGLALPNMGDIDRQSLAGSLATGTHGTGLAARGMSASLAAARVVCADGEVREVSDTDNPSALPAIRLGLGALGILSEITLRCVPSFMLAARERREPVDHVIESYLERTRTSDHFEFFWFPHTDTVLTKTNTRLAPDEPARPLGRLRGWVDDHVMANRFFAATCRLGAALPGTIPAINRVAARLTASREFSGTSYRVFVSERSVRFAEMEYAVELERVPEILREIRALISARDWKISFPVEVRSAAADDIWLSTAQGRQTGYIAVHQYYRSEPGEYFRAVEAIFRAHGGRPHWGKMHTAEAEYLHSVYPHLADFVRLRSEWDPEGRFNNDYLRRVLGT